jgi:hypothetical protein
MGRAQREKGKTWEREMAAAFRELFGQQVRRGGRPEKATTPPTWREHPSASRRSTTRW